MTSHYLGTNGDVTDLPCVNLRRASCFERPASVCDHYHRELQTGVLCCVATCNLNQWALDFDGNLHRVRESILIAKSQGARYRIGPELEVCGYGCEDHFLENDTIWHCWESIAELLSDDTTDGILCDIGIPVLHRGVRYNCRCLCLDRKILLLRPKIIFANDGNYRESRFFTQWLKGTEIEDFLLPLSVQAVTGQNRVPIGNALIDLLDTTIACETCEELWTPQPPHTSLFFAGAEIIGNGSGSHHQLRKLDTRLDLIKSATLKSGGAYLYANQRGCDGNRLYYDGAAIISVNGLLLGQASQFSLLDVEVISANVDLQRIRSYRAAMSSRCIQAASLKNSFCRIDVPFRLTTDDPSVVPSINLDAPKICEPMQEIALGPACWLWDFLRRSGASGFFVPLSGGADSSSVATIVGSMCQIVDKTWRDCAEVKEDLMRVLQCETEEEIPQTAAGLANKLLHTTYLGTENSSAKTRLFARKLSGEIGAYHLEGMIDPIVSAIECVFTSITGKSPDFAQRGGSSTEDLALQNIQARSRMVVSYMLASLLPWTRGRRGWLLVLGTGNVDECLRGYLTKYDNSSGDINPIGGISKRDLLRFLRYAASALGYQSLSEIVEAPPTAELRPLGKDRQVLQTDEEDMGMTYEELAWYGKLRKVQHCGPVEMYSRLLARWTHLTPLEVAEKVKDFFRRYAQNRHKMTVMTPSYHAEQYSPDDHRFDHRPFLYPIAFSRQFRVIQHLAKVAQERRTREGVPQKELKSA